MGEQKCGNCIFFERDWRAQTFGWCRSTDMKIPPSKTFPTGIAPSTGDNHGTNCNYFKSPSPSPSGEEGR